MWLAARRPSTASATPHSEATSTSGSSVISSALSSLPRPSDMRAAARNAARERGSAAAASNER